jgi:hypothetical protein
MNTSATYRHTQHAPLYWVLYVFGGVMLAVGATLVNVTPAWWALFGSAVLMFVLGASFHWLSVEDAGDRLLVAFGPLPLFRRSVRYADVTGVEVGRSTVLEGWGIHLSLHGGWIWNLWGCDCVILTLRRGRLTIGSDDAANLAAFLRSRIA